MNYYGSKIEWELECKDGCWKAPTTHPYAKDWISSFENLAKQCQETADLAKDCRESLGGMHDQIEGLTDIVDKFKEIVDDFNNPPSDLSR